MSNRLLSILVLIWIIWAGYLYYNLKYIPNKQAKIQQELKKQEEEIQVQKETKLTKQTVDEVKLTNAQKIDELKESNKNYKTFKLDNLSTAYFAKNENSLDLFYWDVKIGNFSLVDSSNLRVESISWVWEDLYIEVWAEKFYYNKAINTTQKIDLNINVNYVKEWSFNSIIFVTTKWSFVYSIFDKTFEYFSYFNDFVYFKDWYVWLVKKDEKTLLNNLWFENIDNNIIVYYNPNTKEKKIVYKTDLNVSKIFIYNNSIFIKTQDWEVYELENM